MSFEFLMTALMFVALTLGSIGLAHLSMFHTAEHGRTGFGSFVRNLPGLFVSHFGTLSALAGIFVVFAYLMVCIFMGV